MNMKYILIVFLFLAGGITGGVGQAGAVVCQNGTAIVYGNGMFNSWDDSNDSRKDLMRTTYRNLQASPPSQFTVAELEFHLAYVNDRNLEGQVLQCHIKW